MNRLLGDLYASIERAGVGATTLAQTATQLAVTERFLKMQNDAVRLQASGEADALRAQNGQLRERIDHLLLEVDQYRRAVASGRGQGDSWPSANVVAESDPKESSNASRTAYPDGLKNG